MDVAIRVAALWGLFGLTHMGLSSVRVRSSLMARLGNRGFLMLYSVVALACFVPMVSIYVAGRHAGPLLWFVGASPGLWLLGYAGMGVALALVAAGGSRLRPPAALGGRPAPLAGVLRITRHPVFMGAGLFGLMHLLMAPINATELAFFGGFPIFALLGCAHQDQRRLAVEGSAYREFHDTTAFLPFARIGEVLTGIREDAIRITVGVAAAAGARYLH